MKILLVRPPAVAFKYQPDIILNEPLGILYLAGYLKKYHKNVAVIDGLAGGEAFQRGDFYGLGLSYDKLAEEVREHAPDIVGISHMYSFYSQGVYDTAKIIKDINRNIFIVCGGTAAGVSSQELLQGGNINMVVSGEGEQVLLGLVERMETGGSLFDLPGTVLKVGGEIKVNPPQPFLADLNVLPFPARELLDMSKYYNDRYSLVHGMRYPRLSMVTSRGCPFNCVFCSIHSVWRHKYRARSAENVVDEIEFLYNQLGIKEIIFYDDNMTFDKRRINQICSEIKRRKIDIRWSVPNGVAIWTLDKETIRNMKSAGCFKITFGLESGSLATLKFIHKDFLDFAKAKELIRFSNNIGLWTVSSFIIGLPFEKKEDLELTLSFAIASDVDAASFYCAMPLPGTELYDICKKEGLLDTSESVKTGVFAVDKRNPDIDMKYLTKEEIKKYSIEINKKFLRSRIVSFSNPLRLLRKIRGMDELRYVFRMVKNYARAVASSFTN